MRRLLLALAVLLALPAAASGFDPAEAPSDEDTLADMRDSAVGRPLAAALDACGVRVVRHAMPKGLGGLFLEARRTIILTTSAERADVRLILAHEATHATRACAGRVPPPPAEPEARPAWIEAMLDEEAEALLTEAEMAVELAEKGIDGIAGAIARRPFIAPLFAMLRQGSSRDEAWATVRHVIGHGTYRTYYEGLFNLSMATQ
ncbi:MAG TPA: DUF6782 family putative metallopeptidase [Azospirillum sp.]|nr:DUF6782 family putative metallopeptidase [Azospirillum sp.]